MIITCRCALVCSSVGLYFVHRFSRMALLENQLEVLFSQQRVSIPHCYRLVDCFSSYKSGPCQDCERIHSPIDFISIFTLVKPCNERSFILSLVSELSIFGLLYLFLNKYGLNAIPYLYVYGIYLFIITIVDYRYYIIPDELNFLGIVSDFV